MNVSLLKRICEIAGAPGFEQRIRALIIEEVRPYVDEIRTNNKDIKDH